MIIDVQIDRILIMSETPQDTIYRQKMLGLTTVGDKCECTLQIEERTGRRYIEIRPTPVGEV